MKWLLTNIVVPLVLAYLVDGCTSERDRADGDRKLKSAESRFQQKLDDLQRRRDEGGHRRRDSFPAGSGPIGAEPAAAPGPAASSAVGDVGNGHVTLKVESEL